MNPYNLDGNDFLQVVSITAALLIGFLPNVKSMRSSDNKITAFGYLMIVLFGFSVFFAVFSTVTKSSSDKDDYRNLLDRTNISLQKANENIEKADSILSLQGKSLEDLKKLQKDAMAIQSQELLLVSKSDSIQVKSEQLNEKLAQEIILQKEVTKTSDTIFKRIENERVAAQKYNQLRLMLCITSLRFLNVTLYDGLQLIKTDYNTKLLQIQKNLLQLDKQKSSFDSSYKKNIAEAAKIIDSINSSIRIYVANINKTMSFTITDSMIVTKAVKDFLEQTLLLLDSQLSNPVVQSNSKLFQVWFQYFNELYVKREIYYIDKSTLNSIGKVRELIARHDGFLAEVQRNSSLSVIIDNN